MYQSVFSGVNWLSPCCCVQVKESGDVWDVGTALLLGSACTRLSMKLGTSPVSGRWSFSLSAFLVCFHCLGPGGEVPTWTGNSCSDLCAWPVPSSCLWLYLRDDIQSQQQLTLPGRVWLCWRKRDTDKVQIKALIYWWWQKPWVACLSSAAFQSSAKAICTACCFFHVW